MPITIFQHSLYEECRIKLKICLLRTYIPQKHV